MKRKTKQTTVEIPYCTECKSICIQIIKSVTRIGIVTDVLNKNGFPEEIAFDIDDSSVDEVLCEECQTAIHHNINIDIELFRKIRQKVIEEEATNFFVKITPKEGEDFEDISPERIRDLIFEALI